MVSVHLWPSAVGRCGEMVSTKRHKRIGGGGAEFRGRNRHRSQEVTSSREAQSQLLSAEAGEGDGLHSEPPQKSALRPHGILGEREGHGGRSSI